MSTLPQSAAARTDIEALRRKLAFRAWHRGTREADLLVGSFADRYLPGFDQTSLLQFESLLQENDPDIYDWMLGLQTPPSEHQNPVGQLLCQFRQTKIAT
jgi:antitoxin CptB